MHTASIIVRSPQARLLATAVGQEDVPRVAVAVSCSGNELQVTVRAENAAHLRAACNSFLEWIDLAERVGRLVDCAG